ncbi:MAG: transglutaminase family protein [Myxococcales bacterium]|jgi:hypothetical protein|nr:transglutaminase family protein [Myxococcales bacterium]
MTLEKLDHTLDPTCCLGSTPFIEADHPRVRSLARELGGALDPPARAARLFRFVRDELRYEFRAKLTRDEYRASLVLEDGKGFCVQKAVLLSALARAVDVPAALVLCDLRDRSLSPKLTAALGTDTMFYHGLNAFYLGGRWLLADASLSPDVVDRKGYRTVEFDGSANALLAASRLDGSPHAEYLRFHGLFDDLPFDRMMEAFMMAYGQADLRALAELGYRL